MSSAAGKLIIFSAPSGSGKTTLVHDILQTFPQIQFSVSACSRPRRENELHGKDYYFLSPEEFQERISNGAFVEWEEVYPGSFYGTLHSEIEKIWNAGRHVIFDVDVEGGLKLKQVFPDRSLSVYVQVPDIKTLENRLRARNTESEETLARRLEKASREMQYAHRFDKVVVNTDLQSAISQSRQMVADFLNR
ncbi:MAG: guanylate kinase [Bacteroidota bacterium]|jgi:guanylate kinase